MIDTILIIFGLAVLRISIAQNSVIGAQFYETWRRGDLAILGEKVQIICEIQCDVGEWVELIGPNRAIVSSGECMRNYDQPPELSIIDLRMNESLVFGEYKCKYKDRVIEERASSWVYHYRTCSKAERQGVTELNPKRLFVVDSNDPSCHMVRTCGDRQHIHEYPRLVCPANSKSICHAAMDEKYAAALLAPRGIGNVQSCSEKPAWFISYAGNPVVLQSMIPLHKSIRNFKVHCPPGSDEEVECETDGGFFGLKFKTKCTVMAELRIPDDVFTTSRGYRFHCSAMNGQVSATMVYADPDHHNMTCTELENGSIKCDFQSHLWNEFEVKKSIKCSSGGEQDTVSPSPEEFFISSPEQCEEYTIVADVFYEHPGTHETFKLPTFQSDTFRKKPKQPVTDVASNVTENAGTPAAPSNAADLVDPNSWRIGIAMWSILQAMI